MIHAHFNIRLDGAWLPESIGQWVADRDAARAAACTIIRQLVLRHGGEPDLLDAVMVVSDPEGATLLELSFFEALYQPVEPVADPGRSRGPRATLAPSDTRIAVALRPVRRFADALSTRIQPLIGPRGA